MAPSLKQLLRAVRRKLQAERVLKGVATVLLYSLLVSLLFSYVLASHNFSDSALFWSRLLGGAGFLAIFLTWVIWPLFRPPSDQRVARFLEENWRGLEDRLSTAVELADSPGLVHPQIGKLIERDASRQLSKLAQPRLYHPRSTLSSLLVVVTSLLAAALLFLGGPEVYRYSLNKLLAGWFDNDQAPLYSIRVSPGNITVPERADQEIEAMLFGFHSNRVLLFARYENQPQWEQVQMQPAPEGGAHTFYFFDIRDRIDYYVEADGIRSDTFTILVSEIPRVQSLRVHLEFPSYTHLKPVTLENEGDIRALAGTRVRLEIETDQPVSRALLRFENAAEIPLEQQAPRKWKAAFKVERNDFYRIHLANQENVLSAGSDEYFIEALQDQPPVISITQPGRDRKVTNIEEVYAEVNSEDDHGLQELALRISVNGGPEQNIPLALRRGTTEATASHTFFLEEFDLVPGDFISYYARASDAVTSSSTDIYFLEVEPFDKEFYQSQAGAAGFGGENFDFVKQQKLIIAATFRLVQQRRQFSTEEFNENSQTLGLLQQELQKQAQTILDRIQRRGAAMSDPRFQKMAEYLENAVTHMQAAHQALNQIDPDKALPEEQKSLQQLLRAEALFKEIQISFSQSPGDQGASPEDLADLVDLELDRTKNQYETLQQNQAQKREQALDEALEKLKELAQRQQQQLERQRGKAQQGSGSGAAQSDDQLIEEIEKLARELARLSRQQQESQLSQISNELRRAVRDLKQARSSGQNAQESLRAGQEALQRLQEAGRRLSQQQQQQIRENLEKLKQASQALLQDQKEVLANLEQLEQRMSSGEMDQETNLRYGQLVRKKGEMQEDLNQLEDAIHQAARQTESQEPAASRKLKQAGIDIRDQRIPDKMQEGTQLMARGWMNLARQREETVRQDLETLAERIAEAEQALGTEGTGNSEERLRQALDRTTKLTDKLESLRQRAQAESRDGQRSQEEQQGQSSENGDAQSSSQAQGQQGRQGQSSSQQGTEAQQARQQGSQSGQDGFESGLPAQAGGTPRPSSGIDPRQFRREWQERLNETQDLRRILRENPDLATSVNDLLREMRRLDADRILLDPKELEALNARIIQGFHQLELEISQLLQQHDRWIRLANEDEIPAEFREKVEEYYRLLSEGRREGKPPSR